MIGRVVVTLSILLGIRPQVIMIGRVVVTLSILLGIHPQVIMIGRVVVTLSSFPDSPAGFSFDRVRYLFQNLKTHYCVWATVEQQDNYCQQLVYPVSNALLLRIM